MELDAQIETNFYYYSPPKADPPQAEKILQFGMSSFLRTILLTTIIAAFIGYLAFQMKGFIFGSDLLVSSPFDGEHVVSSHVVVKGRAVGISFLSLDGRNIFTDDKGFFEEELILPYGLNIIRIFGKGRFGKVFQEERMIYITGN